MFSNLSKYVLWELAPKAVQAKDEETTQALYESEQRGQTQRFLIGLGDIVVELFNKIESSFNYGNPSTTSQDLLKFLQRKFYANHIEVTGATEARIREFVAEIVTAWRFKGTQAFLHWIIWKVFDWKLVQAISLASEVLITSVNNSYFYDPSLPEEQQKVLYEPLLMTPEDKLTLVIDVFGDAYFPYKKDTLERLIDEWSYPTSFIYLNVPNVLANGLFENWTADDPDDWTISAEDAGNYVTENDEGARITSDGGGVSLAQTNLVVSTKYRVILIIFDVASGSVDLKNGATVLANYTTDGEKQIEFTATSTELSIASNGSCSVIVKSISATVLL